MRAARTILLTFGLVTISSLALAKAAPTPVTQCGQVLSVPGQYVLPSSLNCGAPVCPNGAITITASKVRLNTNGQTVSAICAAVVVADGVSNVHITGGGSLLGGSGVIIGNASNILIQGLAQINGSSDLGSTETGVEIGGGKNISVINNHIAGVLGINGTVTNGLISGNTLNAVGIAGSGITLGGSGNIIRDNVITQSGAASQNVAISVAGHNVVERNTINQAGIGIFLSADHNKILNNTVHGASPPTVPVASQNGIQAAPGAIQNTIVRNVVMGNQSDLLDANGPPCMNVWRHNHFATSSGAVACIH